MSLSAPAILSEHRLWLHLYNIVNCETILMDAIDTIEQANVGLFVCIGQYMYFTSIHPDQN